MNIDSLVSRISKEVVIEKIGTSNKATSYDFTTSEQSSIFRLTFRGMEKVGVFTTTYFQWAIETDILNVHKESSDWMTEEEIETFYALSPEGMTSWGRKFYRGKDVTEQ